MRIGNGVSGLLLCVGLLACTGKDTDTADTGGDTGVADTGESECESGQAVLRATARTETGDTAPSGSLLYAEDSSGTVTETVLDEFGEARINLPQGDYAVWAANDSANLLSSRTDTALPGCRTTSVDLVMMAADR